MAKTVSMQQVAHTYGVSLTTVRRYVKAGRLKAFRVGPRMVRLDPEQVAREMLGTPIR